MYLIAGLGNPGKEYEKTRHNAGYDALDLYAEKKNISITRKKFKGLVGDGFVNGEKVILLKPETFMNLSGESIREAAEYYDIPEENIIVLCDDIYLEVGTLRVRGKGSAGGHNGLKNIILQLASDNFKRVRIGVGPEIPETGLVNFVLGHFDAEKRKVLEKTFEDACGAIDSLIFESLDQAMCKYNGKKNS